MNGAGFIWTGTQGILEDILRFSYDEDASGATCVRVYTGPYGDIMATLPKRGAVMTDIPSKPIVEKSRVTRPAPGVGELTVTARVEFSGDGAGTPTDDQPVYELEWSQLEKPLEAHKRYNDDSALAHMGMTVILDPIIYTDLKKMSVPLLKAMTVTLGEVIQMMKSLHLSDRKIITDALEEYAEVQDLINDFFQRVGRGMSAFFIPAPVARITTRSSRKPNTTTMGKRGTPPGFPGLPSGYEWLGTVDRAVRQGRNGKWERVREWTGADGWDHDIYEAT